MARFEFTVPPLAPPLDQRVRLDTAADDSGSSVTDVLIGGRVADPAQGFDLRGVATFLGPDGVDTLYLKALNYRGKVIGASIALAGVASGGGSGPLLLHIVVPIAFDTAGLVAGIDVPGWTPQVGDVVTNVVVSAPSAWDGTAACDVGLDGQAGWFLTSEGNFCDITNFPDTDNGNGTSIPGNKGLVAGMNNGGALLITEATPVKIWVSGDGNQGGAATGSTIGEATVHVWVSPVSFT